MLGRSTKRLILLIAVMLVLYFVLTSATVYTLLDNAWKAVKNLVGLGPADTVTPKQSDTTGGTKPPTNIVYRAANSEQPAGTTRIILYFADRDVMFLVPVTRSIPLSKTPIKDTLTELIRGPAADSGLVSPFIEMAIRDLNLRTDGTLRIDIPTQVVQASTGWGSSASVAALESLVNTVSHYSAVKRVQFMVGGKLATTLFHGLAADEPIPAQTWETAAGRMTLYYAIFSGNRAYLVPDQVEVASSDTIALLKQAVEQLKVGKSVGDYKLHPTLPANINVLGVDLSGRTAMVNLSGEFSTVLTLEPAQQSLLLDSLVMTLTSFPQVDQVQILVEGNKVAQQFGGRDIGSPLARPKWINPE